VAGSAAYLPSLDETLSRLSDPDFDARNTVLLDSKVGTSSSSLDAGSAGQVESFRRRPNSVTLQVELARPGYVVLLDRFDPNWHATVDGREVKILPADFLFRAVRVGAGRHTVHFYYQQRWLLAGLLISLGTLGLCAVLFILDLQVPVVGIVSGKAADPETGRADHEGGPVEASTVVPGARQ